MYPDIWFLRWTQQGDWGNVNEEILTAFWYVILYDWHLYNLWSHSILKDNETWGRIKILARCGSSRCGIVIHLYLTHTSFATQDCCLNLKSKHECYLHDNFLHDIKKYNLKLIPSADKKDN